jgi:hypothetical protein
MRRYPTGYTTRSIEGLAIARHAGLWLARERRVGPVVGAAPTRGLRPDHRMQRARVSPGLCVRPYLCVGPYQGA